MNDRHRKDANGQPEATFFNCTAWRGLADVVSRFATKGTKVCVTGPVSCRTYQGNDGVTRASLDVTVQDFEFCSSRSSGESSGEAAPAPKTESKPAEYAPVTDTELPF